MIRHIVMWNLDCKGENKQELEKKIKTKFESLKGVIPEIIDARVGININLDDKDKKDLVLIVDIKDMDDLRAYANHEEHIRVLGEIKKYLIDRTVIDFKIGV